MNFSLCSFSFIYPVTRHFLYLSLFLTILTTLPARADKIRISPEDLKLRAAVSRRLSAPLRVRLQDIAAKELLSPQEGEEHTASILDTHFPTVSWSNNDRLLVYYYLLTTRLEKSQAFATEFARREGIARQGRELMREYLNELNRFIGANASYPNQSIDLGEQKSFPLVQVGWAKIDEADVLLALHSYPKLKASLGRDALRSLRNVALNDLQQFDEELSRVRVGQREFIDEVSLLGNELIALRSRVSELLPYAGEGLLFSL